jgi:glucokinase
VSATAPGAGESASAGDRGSHDAPKRGPGEYLAPGDRLLHPGSPVAIALDLGGTNLKGGLVGPGGTHVGLASRTTRPELGYDGVLTQIAAFVDELREEAAEGGLSVVGIGVGAPGPLNRREGVIEFAPNLGWSQAPLGADLARLTGIERVRLENDANAAAFAEAWIGEGSAARCLLGVTLGTGVGAGLVIGGRLFTGATGLAAELGHVVVRPHGRPCRCGGRGCVEAYFSAWALVERCREHAGDHPGHAMDLDGLTPEGVFEGWLRGDSLAGPIMELGLRSLALALAGCLNLLNPDRVTFFGGLSRSWDAFGPALVGHVRESALASAFSAARFSASRLEWAGVLGAGGLVLSQTPDL